MNNENEKNNTIITNIQTSSNRFLSDGTLSDKELALVRFSELTLFDTPRKPLPVDTCEGIRYTQYMEEKCKICTSPWRDRAEHVYLENNKRIAPVRKFFKDYFNADLTAQMASTHFRRHCDFSRVGIDGIGTLNVVNNEAEIQNWKGRELDLIYNGIMYGIDELMSLDTKNRPELIMEKQKILRTLYRDLKDLAKDRAESPINIFEILQQLFTNVQDKDSKRIISETIREVRKNAYQTMRE